METQSGLSKPEQKRAHFKFPNVGDEIQFSSILESF